MSLPLFSQPLSPVDSNLIEAARTFAKTRILPLADQWERCHEQPDCLREAIGQFTRYYIPKQLGGLGASPMSIALELEELARADYGFTFGFEVHNHVAMVTGMSSNHSARDRYLPRLMSGDMVGSFLLTEPEAGSDAASIRTTAVLQDGKWILNGEKAWITNAVSADLLLVFAQAGTRARDMMAFFVERNTPGVELTEQYDMVGAHAMGTGAFRFHNCVVDDTQVAFRQGEAFKAALGGIDFARFAVAAMCNGACANCLETAITYAKNRVQFQTPIFQNQGIQFKLADALTRLEASRLLTFQAAKLIDEGAAAPAMMAHCKKYASRIAYESANAATQCMGSNGLNRSYPLVRQTSALAIAYNTDGTNEICNMVIGKAM